MGENKIVKEEENSEIIISNENNSIIVAENSPISNIVSEKELKVLLDSLMKEFEVNKDEAMDMYYIFKDMITNSGDFDSSGAVKEQVANLLKVAQEATVSKMRVFETIFRSKLKTQTINAQTVNQQNNLYLGGNRRDLLKAIEEIQKDKKITENIINEISDEEENKEENIEIENVNIENKEQKIEFQIQSGDL